MKKSVILILFIIIVLLPDYNCGDGGKEFTIWIGGAPQEIDFWQKLVNEFQNKTGTKIRLVRQPTYTDQRRQGLIISLEAKQHNPDLFLMDVVWIDQFVKSGWLQPLNNYINRDSYNTDVFFPSVLNSVDVYDSQVYALPVFLDIALLYYRKDLLKQAGFSDPPSTWTRLVNDARKIQRSQRKTNPNFNGFDWQGAQYEGLVCTFLEFITSRGGSMIKNGKLKLNSAENISALTFMRDLIYKYKISPLNTYTEMKEEPVRRDFQNGNALFERNWTYAWGQHQSAGSPVKGKVGIAPLPHSDHYPSTSTLGGWHIGLSKYSDVKNEAWKFIKFVTSYKVQKQLFTGIGWNPGRKDIYKDSLLLKQLPRLQILYEVFKSSVSRPTLPYYTQVSKVIQRNVNDCLADKISAGTALNEAQKDITRITEIYGDR